jgi:ribonuclease J
MGRSLNKYVSAAQKIGIIDFSQVKIVGYGNKVNKFFKNLKNPENYLFVVTGHEAEPKAVLSRMVYKKIFNFQKEDHVIFSCTIIPTKINLFNRESLEAALKNLHVRIFRDIHVSGHAAREDLRDLINMVKPEYIFPIHADIERSNALKDLAIEMGYPKEKIIIMDNSQRISI